ncbi:MAG: helix-turn-helix domain-containing protein [Parachlamydiaceae bacterium]
MKENVIKSNLKSTLDNFPNKEKEKKGLSRNKLAVESKIRPATISQIYNDEAKAVQFDTLVSILNALNRLSLEEGDGRRYTIEDIFTYEAIEKDAPASN